jgi:hypothetical protein
LYEDTAEIFHNLKIPVTKTTVDDDDVGLVGCNAM